MRRRVSALPFLAGYTEKVQNKVAQSTGWDDLVNLVSSGPPIYSPFKLLDSVANLGEMFIHHEDVRRAIDGWQPRVLDASIATPLRRQLGLMSRMMLSKLPAQVELRTPAGERIARVGRGDAVTVTGEPQELLLSARLHVVTSNSRTTAACALTAWYCTACGGDAEADRRRPSRHHAACDQLSHRSLQHGSVVSELGALADRSRVSGFDRRHGP